MFFKLEKYYDRLCYHFLCSSGNPLDSGPLQSRGKREYLLPEVRKRKLVYRADPIGKRHTRGLTYLQRLRILLVKSYAGLLGRGKLSSLYFSAPKIFFGVERMERRTCCWFFMDISKPYFPSASRQINGRQQLRQRPFPHKETQKWQKSERKDCCWPELCR